MRVQRQLTTMLAALALIVTGGAVAADTDPRRAACRAHLERARAELLDRGFAPTTDRDTARWLEIYESEDGTLSLALIMRASADGAQTGYALTFSRTRKRAPTRWRYQRRKRCCDDHAERTDHLVELKWQRGEQGWLAAISIIQSTAALRDRGAAGERALFYDIARVAADECLAANP